MKQIDYSTLNIRHFKMSSGEDIIGMVVDPSSLDGVNIDPTEVAIIDNPLIIKSTDTGENMVFHQHLWQPFSKTSYCFVNTNHIISHVECSDAAKEMYISYFNEQCDEPENVH